ncbi:sugar phosphate isomerase/epimerase [Paracoccus sediminis]|uniref:Sugar phosphate isomerase/epimerase n=1 Tax=Paracoccus sediminis TaxID=1214787 RepID=A0A238UWQ8_9RHOB|nr:TIM barrel protein [Paracoccus sediminis]TBN52735.1 sugar phosphate isomerase/epimerase [Paracoccus sediminis]SNR26284.1 Sugar phosphate isomerase/epimerase [Paracoccus sediminis]
MRPVGLAHFSAIELGPAELVSAAARAGFAAVGLRLFPAFPGAPCYAVPQGSRAARDLRRRLDDTGLAVHDIEFVVIDADFRPQTLLPVLEDAAALGARRLSVCGQDGDRARLIDSFAALCALADRIGMGVDLENMGWRPIRALSDSLAVVRAAGASNGGVLADALHLFRNGATADDLAAVSPPCLRHAQLCDARGPSPLTDALRMAEARGGRLPPGQGELPLSAMLTALPPDAHLSVEVPMNGGQDVDAHLACLMRGARSVLLPA